jgi:uncharacterized protein (DUF2252 family)
MTNSRCRHSAIIQNELAISVFQQSSPTANARLDGRSVFIRELLPQDLKIEIERLTVQDAMKAASFLAGVVGKAHARQMDDATRKGWHKELERNRTTTLEAPSWLWSSVVSLIGSHEVAYLEHCRRYATQVPA